MGRHERIEEVVVPPVEEPAPAAPAEDLAEVQEVWDDRVFDFANKLAFTVVRGFGRVAVAVEAAGGSEIEEEDGVRVKTEAGGWLDEIAPQAAFVPLARASRLRRLVTPVEEDEPKFGWIVADLERTDSPRSPADDEEGKDAGRAADEDEWDELKDDSDTAARSHVEVDEDEDMEDDTDLDVFVDRVVLVAGVRHALRLVTGTRRELDGHEGPIMRIPVLKPVVDSEGKRQLPSEEDREVIDAYAARNGFSTKADRQVITPEVIAADDLKAEDPVELGWAARKGLADLADKVSRLAKQAREQGRSPQTVTETQPDEELAE